MTALRVRCEGFQVGRLVVPPFQLQAGEFVCLHVPPDFGEERELLAKTLSSGRDTPALHFAGRVTWVERPIAGRGFLGRWKNPRGLDWLTGSAGLTVDQAASVLQRLEISAELRIGSLAGDPKLLVGLEAALATRADIIVFDTLGASPRAIQRAYEIIAANKDGLAFLQLSYAYEKWRVCSPHARCINLIQPSMPCTESATATIPSASS